MSLYGCHTHVAFSLLFFIESLPGLFSSLLSLLAVMVISHQNKTNPKLPVNELGRDYLHVLSKLMSDHDSVWVLNTFLLCANSTSLKLSSSKFILLCTCVCVYYVHAGAGGGQRGSRVRDICAPHVGAGHQTMSYWRAMGALDSITLHQPLRVSLVNPVIRPV